MTRVLKGGILIAVFTSIAAFLNYLLRLFYSRSLSVDDYGLFYAGIGLVNILLTYISLGYSYSIAYLVPKYIKIKNYETAWNVYKYAQIIQIIASVTISIFGIVAAPLIFTYYFKSSGNIIFIYLLVLYFLASSVLNTLYYFYIGLQNEKYYSSLLLVRVVLVAFLSLAFWANKLVSINDLLFVWGIGCIITIAIFWFILHKKYKYLTSNKLVWNKKLLDKMTGYAVPSILAMFVYSFINYGDIFFLSLITDVRSVAYYSVILPLASLPLLFTSPLDNLFLPLMSDLMEGEKTRATILVNKVVQIIPVISLYFALFLFIFPSSVISVLFGVKWLGFVEEWLGLLSLGFVMMSLANLLQTIIIGMGMVKERLKISILVAFVSILSYIVLISLFGVSGAVVANVLVSAISLILYYWVASHRIAIKVPGVYCLKVSLLVCVAFIVSRFVHPTAIGILSFLLLGVAYSLVFGLLVYLLKLVDLDYVRIIITAALKRRGITWKKADIYLGIKGQKDT